MLLIVFKALFGWAKSPGWADSCWSSRTAYSAIRTSSIFCQHLCHLADPSSRYSKNQQVLCRLEQAQPSQPFLGHPNRLMVRNMLTSLTVTFDTHAFVLSRPSPPMLIPWPGPQFTLCIFMLLHPVWMEIQSSPALNKTNWSH